MVNGEARASAFAISTGDRRGVGTSLAVLTGGVPTLPGGGVMLFVTNLLAIVLMGTFTFPVMGFSQAAIRTPSQKARRTAIAVFVVLTVAIIVPLGITSSTEESSFLRACPNSALSCPVR